MNSAEAAPSQELQPGVAVNIFLCNGLDTLVLEREGEPVEATRPGEPDLPGGAVEPGEDPMRAAIREVGEEVGQAIANTLGYDNLVIIHAETDVKPNAGLSLTRIYFLAHTACREVELGPEHRSGHWYPREELSAILSHPAQQRALERLINHNLWEKPVA